MTLTIERHYADCRWYWQYCTIICYYIFCHVNFQVPDNCDALNIHYIACTAHACSCAGAMETIMFFVVSGCNIWVLCNNNKHSRQHFQQLVIIIHNHIMSSLIIIIIIIQPKLESSNYQTISIIPALAFISILSE